MEQSAWSKAQNNFDQKKSNFSHPMRYALCPLPFFKRHAPCAMPYAFKHASLRQFEQFTV